MRVSKEKAGENRTALLQAASRLFRQRGIEGVGVADIAREAGLTHGALYAHFSSKDELAAEAFSHGSAGNLARARARARAGDRCPSFQEYLDGLLSTYMRDNVETGCPFAASASEIGRQGCAVWVIKTDRDHRIALAHDYGCTQLPKAGPGRGRACLR